MAILQKKPFGISLVSARYVPFSKIYSSASISENTIQKDIQKLIELELVRKTVKGFVTKTDILRIPLARRRLLEAGATLSNKPL